MSAFTQLGDVFVNNNFNYISSVFAVASSAVWATGIYCQGASILQQLVNNQQPILN